jgi:hypothetical protein
MKTKLAIGFALVALLAADFVQPAAAKEFWEDYLPSGIAGRALANAYAMAEDAVLVLKALKAYPPGARIPESDAILNTAWQIWEWRYLDEISDCDHCAWFSKDIMRYSTPLEYRNALKMQASMIRSIIKRYNTMWKQLGGSGVTPGYYPDIVRIFDVIIDEMDPYTGHIVGDVPPRLRATQ